MPPEHEQQEADTDHALYRQHPGDHAPSVVAAEGGDGGTPAGQHKGPQSSEPSWAPHTAEILYTVGQQGVAVVRNVGHREIVIDNPAPGPQRRSPARWKPAPGPEGDHIRPGAQADEQAPPGEACLDQGQDQGQDEGEVTDLEDRRWVTRAFWAASRAAAASAWGLRVAATSGGMYSPSSCLARTSSARKVPSGPSLPQVTTPRPSLKRSGRMPDWLTLTFSALSVTPRRSGSGRRAGAAGCLPPPARRGRNAWSAGASLATWEGLKK